MKIDLVSENNIIKKVTVDFSPIEFMLFRHILNLAAIHTELHEIDSRVAIRMHKEIDEYLKEKQK